MTSERTGSQTDANLLVALAGEADANRALSRVRDRGVHGRGPDIALFFEAAGAETIHALDHLRTMRTIGITRENLQTAATGEMMEIDVVLPRMIREAEAEGRADAAASFRLALERERHHREMFRTALETFDRPTGVLPPPRAPARAIRIPIIAGDAARPPERPHMSAPGHPDELATEAPRIERLSSIREVVFGARTASSRRSRWWQACVNPG